MKLLVRVLSIALFIVFFDFALKNTDEVVLNLFWNAKASSPLILLLLGFFAARSGDGCTCNDRHRAALPP